MCTERLNNFNDHLIRRMRKGCGSHLFICILSSPPFSSFQLEFERGSEEMEWNEEWERMKMRWNYSVVLRNCEMKEGWKDPFHLFTFCSNKDLPFAVAGKLLIERRIWVLRKCVLQEIENGDGRNWTYALSKPKILLRLHVFHSLSILHSSYLLKYICIFLCSS